MIKSRNTKELKPVIVNTERENLPNFDAIVNECSDDEQIMNPRTGEIVTLYVGRMGYPKMMTVYNRKTGLFSLYTRKDQFSKLVWNK